MASSGITAWNKYFKSHKEIATRMKSDATLYDENGVTAAGKIKKNEEVIFVNEGKYESRALIKYKGKQHRTSFNSLHKPVAKTKATIDVKPQSFGINENTYYTTDKLRETIQDAIMEREDLTPDMKVFLEDLLLWHSEGDMVSDAELKESFARIKKETTFVNRVKTDFSEALGPFALIRYDLLEKIGMNYNLAMNTKSWFPDLPNYPLMDYAVVTGTGNNQKQITISHKAKPGSTNVVKPKDVLELLGKQAPVLRKWKTTHQFKLLEILNSRPILLGGVEAAGYIVKNFSKAAKKYQGLTKKAVDNFLARGNNYDQKLWTTFIANNETIENLKKQKKPAVAKGKVTADAIRYACEKVVEKETVSGGSIPMTDIFVDAVKNQVYYSIFKFGSDGIPSWVLESDTDFKEDDAIFLRTKNSSTKGQDKMGFQP